MDDQQDSAFDEALDDMTDLFDDTNSVIAAPIVPPVSPDVPLRLDELALAGCRQKVAWGKAGAISYISSDGQKFFVRCLARTPGIAHASLCDPVQVELPRAFQLPLAHTAWSLDGANVAVFNSRGSLAIYQIVTALNRLGPNAFFNYEESEASGAVIGLEWLRPNRQNAVCHNVEREGEVWKFHIAPLKPSGISHPLPQRNAFLTASRNGAVRLYYAHVLDKGWGSAGTKVANVDGSEQLLTHAAFSAYKEGTMLLTTYDASATLSLYEIKIDWQFPYETQQQQQQLPAGARLDPSLVATRLLVQHRFSPDYIEQQASRHVELSHLIALPPVDVPFCPQPQPLGIRAFFSVCDASSHVPPTLQSRYTRIANLSVSEESDKLHASFNQIASKKKRHVANPTSKSLAVMRAPDVDVQGVVMSIDTQRSTTLLYLLKGDGTVDVLDRITMQPLSYVPSAEKFSCPLQAGWSFAETDDCTHSALSPNGVMMISRREGDDYALRYLELIGSPVEADAKNSEVLSELVQPDYFADSILQALLRLSGAAMMFANTTFQPHNSDDVFEVIRRSLGFFGVQKTMEHLYFAISLMPECVVDDSKSTKAQKLILHPMIQRTLSFQKCFFSILGEYPVASKVAGAMIDMKFVFSSVQSALFESPQQDLKMGANTPNSLLGTLHYYITTCAYLIDTLLNTQRHLKASSTPITLAALNGHIANTQNPTIPLILCSTPRAFIALAARILRTMGKNPAWLPRAAPAVQLSWQALTAALAAAPIELRRFEQLLEEINHYAREAYEAAGTSDAARGAAERRFLLTAEVPEVLLPVARRLLTSSVTKLVDEARVSPMQLFNMDFSGLAIARAVISGESSTTDQSRLRDTVRKVELSPQVRKVRRCTRCLNVSEDTTDPKKMAYWVTKCGTTCPCSSRWVLVSVGEEQNK